MKKITAALALSLLLSGSALAVDVVSDANLAGYTIKDRISIFGVRGGKSHAVNALKAEAGKKNGEYIYITSLSQAGDSSHWRGTALVLERDAE
ncbi:hypothetical protein NG99_03010 [Erwinia typographi]|uniref:YdgH/BhsA/McbA-like domain-containing protein n=1 Tax=Erwinia typographi TaxID=371042 RepID=A0A0A3Z8X7_9GAMM|nr:YdgH/BhsA/McbA-like domain containing protein [Erwinia typographi]KGT88763.1 hypothetical protein NG99_21100 [Erwinia typographi]KGT95497.1 hypothetical protein NG99_03010 [Erwinia typographi]